MILTYYWPPSGGSGVQRWMYFAKYLKQLGWTPFVITVDEKYASYPSLDQSLLSEVNDIRVIKTKTREPLKWYSLLFTGSKNRGIPQGEVKTNGFLSRLAAFIRGNYFIPDARKGWNTYAQAQAEHYIRNEGISKVITTGPPHSTHLVGLKLKSQFGVQWWADFRDPWTTVFYNKDLYRSARAEKKDGRWEETVLQTADGILTTVGGSLIQKLQAKAPEQSFHVLPNGYDENLMASVTRTNIVEFHVVYTGLLTENQDYSPVMKVLNELAGQYEIRLSLAGNISSSLIEKIKQISPKIAIDYKGYLSHKEAIGLMKSGDLLLNFIFKGADQDMISGKLLEYVASGLPVLSIGNPDSEAGRFLDSASHAQTIKANEKLALKIFIDGIAQQKVKIENKIPDLKKWSRQTLSEYLATLLLKED